MTSQGGNLHKQRQKGSPRKSHELKASEARSLVIEDLTT